MSVMLIVSRLRADFMRIACRLRADCMRIACRLRADCRLLAYGASPLATSADGKRPHEKASDVSSHDLRATSRDLRAAAQLWEASAGPWVPRAALVAAVGRGRLMRVSDLLAARTSPNSHDRYGASALHVAAACADAAAMHLLLAAGAAPDRIARDGTGRRPLHICAAVGSTRCEVGSGKWEVRSTT